MNSLPCAYDFVYDSVEVLNVPRVPVYVAEGPEQAGPDELPVGRPVVQQLQDPTVESLNKGPFSVYPSTLGDQGSRPGAVHGKSP